MTDVAATKAYLEAAKGAGKARRLMERLEDFTGELTPAVAGTLVGILFEEGDRFLFESRGFLDFAADMQVARLIYQCVLRLPAETDRHRVFLEGVRNGTALFTIIQEVSLAEPKDDKPDSRILFDRVQWEELKTAAVTRIQGARSAGAI